MRLAQISDTHFGTVDPPVCKALKEDLLRQAPDLVVLSGDITQRARRSQFRAARAFLASLAPLPALAVPGNHDLPLFDLFTRFTNPYRYYRRYISPELAFIWQEAQVAVVGVNSTRKWRHKHGELPPEMVEQVARQLEALTQAFKVVVLHHPLGIVEARDRNNLARGSEAALAAWIGAGADLFMGGHIHLAYCIPVGAGPRRAVVLQAGTSLSTRRREGKANSYNLVEFDAHRCRMDIQQRDYDGGSGSFLARATWAASRADGGWALRPGRETGGGLISLG